MREAHGTLTRMYCTYSAQHTVPLEVMRRVEAQGVFVKTCAAGSSKTTEGVLLTVCSHVSEEPRLLVTSPLSSAELLLYDLHEDIFLHVWMDTTPDILYIPYALGTPLAQPQW